ncbi:MAG TPA: succinate dehydrogenase, hydrophobic membrane anchor protein [Methylotenera sp.]|nr:succinate dehydrogenase, hydrophobic membrane anchor protein [Methylotenera sp.]HPV45432.1 succinate dehydrogenase, hydrophobic membrane anchor protein [Methylotenera sp.]
MLIQLLTDKYPGMRLWLSQRLTAVIMASYVLFFVIMLIVQRPVGYEAWYTFVSPAWFRFATLLFFVCLFSHAWLGVRDVLRDYIFNLNLRNYLQMLVDILLVIYLAWVSVILWNI